MKLYGAACSASIAMILDSNTRRQPKRVAGLSCSLVRRRANRSPDVSLRYMVSPGLNKSVEPSQEAIDRLLDVAGCPLATTAEIHALSGRGDLSNAHRNVLTLRGLGLISDIDWHSGENARVSARHFVTALGVALLSRRLGVSEAEFLRKFPASTEWQKWLLGRIERVVLVYRIAVQIARVGPASSLPVKVQLPRAGPLDGIVAYSDERFYGVMRQGYGLSLSGFARRLSRQSRERSQPTRVFVVASDGFEKPLVLHLLREHRATLSGVVAEEEDLLDSDLDSSVWTPPGQAVHTRSLRECVGEAADSWRTIPRVKTSYVRAAFPSPLSEVEGRESAELTRAQRRSLRDVFSWTLMDIDQLAALHGLSHSNEARILKALRNLNLVERMRVTGLPHARFALSDEGWRYLSDRDGVDLDACLKKWSVGSDKLPMGTVLAKLIKERDHTEGVNVLASRVATEYGKDVRLLPAHKSVRIFSHRGRDFQVVPDVVATTSSSSGLLTLIFEYEMRATSERDLSLKLLPWLRYFDTRYPYEDFRGTPKLLFIFVNEEAEAKFRDIAQARCDGSGIKLPLFTSTRKLIDECGSLTDPIWFTLRDEGTERSDFS